MWSGITLFTNHLELLFRLQNTNHAPAVDAGWKGSLASLYRYYYPQPIACCANQPSSNTGRQKKALITAAMYSSAPSDVWWSCDRPAIEGAFAPLPCCRTMIGCSFAFTHSPSTPLQCKILRDIEKLFCLFGNSETSKSAVFSWQSQSWTPLLGPSASWKVANPKRLIIRFTLLWI